MEAFLSFMQNDFGTYFQGVLTVVGGAAILATKTPNQSDDRVVQHIWDLVNFVGANVGQAKNSD